VTTTAPVPDLHHRETLEQFQIKISNMVDIYARMHLQARFWSRSVLLVTLSFSAFSASMGIFAGLVPASTSLAWISTVVAGLSLALVVLSLASVIWGWDQRASDCSYAFRRLMSIKTKLRVATEEEARRMQRDYAEFGDDLPQTNPRFFHKLWTQVNRERVARRGTGAAAATQADGVHQGETARVGESATF
jgi:hypothetical protein